MTLCDKPRPHVADSPLRGVRVGLANWLPLVCSWLSLMMMPAIVDACSLCIGFPEHTAIDHVLEADCVVLARQSIDHRYEFEAVEILKGQNDHGSIDLLVDTVTRRYLAADPERKVALVRHSLSRSWRSLGVLSPDYELLLRRVILLAPRWEGAAGRAERVKFFLPLFGHRDPQIGLLAYLEMGRAPYRTIQQLGRMASREDFMPMLERPEYIEWRSLAILMLAQSNDPKDQQRIIDSFQTAHRFGSTTNLAAWAAAAIDVQGETAIEFIEVGYFNQPGRSDEELDAVWKALSLQGSEGDAELRNRIVAACGALTKRAPQFASRVAAKLRTWEHDGATHHWPGVTASSNQTAPEEQ